MDRFAIGDLFLEWCQPTFEKHALNRAEPTPMFYLCLASLATWLFLMARFHYLYRKFRWHPREADSTRRGSLSVVIPARNEEADIESSVRSLLSQRGVEITIIVVNDHSTDRTREILERIAGEDPRLRIVHDPPLPPGWLGKVNAVQHGLAEVKSEYVLITDADIQHQENVCKLALDEMGRDELDFLSIFPRIDSISFWENVLVVSYPVAFAYLLSTDIDDPSSDQAVGAGAFMLIRKSSLDSLGGIACVRQESLDDVMLARRFKEQRLRVRFRFAPEFGSVRLFKGNQHAFFGATKNCLQLIRGRLWLAPFMAASPIFIFWPGVAAIIWGAITRDPLLFSSGVAHYAVQFGSLFTTRGMGTFRSGYTAFFPLVVFPSICCIGRAAYFQLRFGAVLWRGRLIKVNDPPG